jgi:peptidoglycan/xylan/chitin deacetylase (PgdA/CDA1 family)
MLKRLIGSGLATSVGWAATAPIRSGCAVVLMYHRINDDAPENVFFPGLSVSKFRSQMQWLRKCCTPIWPEEALDAARYSSRMRPPVIVTFDDGYRDYYDRAYPILQDLKIPAAVFLPTDNIDNGCLLWTEALYRAVMVSAQTQIETPWDSSNKISLATRNEKLLFVDAAKARLKGAPNDERKRWLADILDRLGTSSPEIGMDRQMLTWQEVRNSMDGTRYGGHSHSHPILSQLTTPEVESEIELCSGRLRAETGVLPTLFAYPNGRTVDFDERTKDALRRHGFELSFSTVAGAITSDVDPLALPRQHAGDHSSGGFAALVARAR